MTWLRENEDVTKEPVKKEKPLVVKKKSKSKVPEPEEVFVSPILQRLSFDQSKKGQTAIMVRESVRVDHGRFTIRVENSHGVATASCEVNVLGKTPILNTATIKLCIEYICLHCIDYICLHCICMCLL